MNMNYSGTLDGFLIDKYQRNCMHPTYSLHSRNVHMKTHDKSHHHSFRGVSRRRLTKMVHVGFAFPRMYVHSLGSYPVRFIALPES